jgi:hypothetical protein
MRTGTKVTIKVLRKGHHETVGEYVSSVELERKEKEKYRRAKQVPFSSPPQFAG